MFEVRQLCHMSVIISSEEEHACRKTTRASPLNHETPESTAPKFKFILNDTGISNQNIASQWQIIFKPVTCL